MSPSLVQPVDVATPEGEGTAGWSLWHSLDLPGWTMHLAPPPYGMGGLIENIYPQELTRELIVDLFRWNEIGAPCTHAEAARRICVAIEAECRERERRSYLRGLQTAGFANTYRGQPIIYNANNYAS
ncbi:MAG: hypothetical protein ACREBW_03145 [Candidatus Micrarchaeaceae archaeon]